MNKVNSNIKEQSISYRLQGIDCADCSVKLEKAMGKLSGVKSAEMNFAASRLTLKIEQSADPESIKARIEGLGYLAEEETTAKTKIFFVKGMDCSEEAEIVKNKLNKLHGVKKFDINLMSQKLMVEYEPTSVSVEDIISSLALANLEAGLFKEREGEKPKAWWHNLKIIFLALSGLITIMAFITERFGISETITNFAYALAIVIGGYYPAKSGLAALRVFVLNINTLLVAATIGAASLGLWEEGALLVFVFSLGAVLESFAVDKARGSIRALMRLAPAEALVKRDGKEIKLSVDEIKIGDLVIVKPGDRIPVDGRVFSGASTVDQSPITGESIPVGKETGDEVFSGTINQRGFLEIETTKLAKDTTLSRIIHLVEEAQAKKASYQRFGDRFGRLYTPIMFALALTVAIVPPLIFAQPFTPWLLRALVVLVVSCSCGLVLSIPVSIVTGIGNAARHGVLMKGGAYLEALGKVKAIAFDKTGTLTVGSPVVTEIVSMNQYSKRDILKVAAAIESRSEHPLAGAILKAAGKENISITAVSEFESVTGLGAKAKVDGEIFLIGNRQFFQDAAFVNGNGDLEKRLIELENQGKTTVILGNQKEILGLIAVADQLRPHIKETIAGLKAEGIEKIIMLTGDNERTAAAIAAQAGVDEYLAELLPDDKVEAIKKLKKQYGSVAMVGDGVNDAPAMAEADVGIAMGAGTDVALETGDLALMSDELLKLPFALHLSHRTLNNIKQNVAASLIIIVFLVPAALLGKVGLVPGLLINEISSLIVILNGIRLLR